MAAVDKVFDLLKSAGVWYLATVDGDQPRVRPFGAQNVYDGKLYIQTGLVKDVAKQLQANGKFEISGMIKGEWFRINGELVYDPADEPTAAMLDANPSLKRMYAVGDGNTAVFYIKNGVCTVYSFTAAPRVIEF